MTKNNINEDKFTKPINDAQEELTDYLLSQSVSDKAKKSGQLGDYYRRGLEAALAKRSASLYGSRGAIRGAQGGALAGAVAAQYMGKKGKTKLGSLAKIGGKGALGGVLGGLVGGAAGVVDPETGMALPAGAVALATGGLGRKAFTSIKNRRALPSRAQVATNQSMKNTRFYRSMPSAVSPEAREAAQKSSALYGGAFGSVAAYLAGKFYGYQSDRFEMAKQGQTDPYLGTVTTSPGIPGYNR